MKGKWGEDRETLARSLWIQGEVKGGRKGGTDRGGEPEEETDGGVSFFKVVFLTLHNTFAYVVRALIRACEGVCVCLVASHWEMGISVKGKGCP